MTSTNPNTNPNHSVQNPFPSTAPVAPQPPNLSDPPSSISQLQNLIDASSEDPGQRLLRENLLKSLISVLKDSSTSSNLSKKSFASLFSTHGSISPPTYPIATWTDGQPALKIPCSILIDSSKDSFSYAAQGRFFGKRPSVEWLEHHIRTSWHLSKPLPFSLSQKKASSFSDSPQ
ncbi:hypothetical protein MRB53_019762 [Persea americana]|uniref:Uncharacterized protein n=1 Tax=Persea americana TaxID=3435 RepID=A0ACC2KZG9_PERAE|nr:hypothetical protein MRB53_019762 [Persea americana]|eukprot:TRINITY_DN10632_c2_g1_i1.p1 TRINITY_DN10632_c2_g1~~TRINITY_DN10632_c2_g1_i1.p1  ORF type:complete len:175 (+),score=36.46 TRINITY_DN10632_c2_g1_i1:350-874(+)